MLFASLTGMVHYMRVDWPVVGKIVSPAGISFAVCRLIDLPKLAPWVALLLLCLLTWLSAAAHAKGPSDVRDAG